MGEIGLNEAIDALRDELAKAVKKGQDAEIQFPVEGIELTFNVGVTKTTEGQAGVRFWVLELGGGATYSAESVQSVTIKLAPPLDRTGTPIQVSRPTQLRP